MPLPLYCPPRLLERVQRWAAPFELLASSERPLDAHGFYLWWDDGRLVLYRDQDPRGVCLQPAEYQRRATLRGELARACGVLATDKPRVADLMAGLGVDGMTLHALGCEVVMVERHPALWALLDSFHCMSRAHDVAANAREVVHADAWRWLQARQDQPQFDVIYLDPMFPTRHKGALPTKPLQFLAALTDPDPHALAEWIALGKQHALARVVLKRRLRDPTVGTPDWQIRGHSVRYDVYRGAHAARRTA